MLSLRADNRDLLRSSKYSYLIDNYLSGVSSLVVDNSTDFTANDYVLLGNFGSETSEIVQINTVTAATNTLSLIVATKFSHAESTKITVIPYNQVKYYQTAAATFSSSENYLGVKDIKADGFFTVYEDTTNTTGYGWFVFYNSTTGATSTNSNAMPYSGFDDSSVKQIFDSFYSLLNNNELKLISRDDAFRWLNESYSVAKNELNLVNEGFTTPAEWTFTVTSSVNETALPTNFSDIISMTDSEGSDVSSISLRDKRFWDNDGSVTDPRYYLRGSYIGISPTPTSTTTYYVYYKAKTASLSSYYSNIELPDNNFYFLVDGMMARAAIKVTRLDRNYHESKFKDGLARMKLTSYKQDNTRDSWDIYHSANV